MVSEDSDQIRTGLPAIHGLSDLDDLEQTLAGPVETFVDHVHAARELLEVHALGRPERIRLEERNDLFEKIVAVLHHVLRHMVTVVVASRVAIDEAGAAEEVPKVFEAMPAAGTLRHDEPVCDLIAELVGASTSSAALANETDREASFSVYKPEDPS